MEEIKNKNETINSIQNKEIETERNIKIQIRKQKKIKDLLTSENSLLWETQLNKYYELKESYEKNARLVEENDHPPLCIQCFRPVGTIFGRKFMERKNTSMVYAHCGDRKFPCSLKIIIFTGIFTNIFTKLELLKQEIAEEKNRIIEWKNNLLFGYETEEMVLDKFEQSKKRITDLNFSLNKFYSLVYQLSFYNREWQRKCANLQETIDTIIFEIHQLESSDTEKWRKLCDAYQRLEPLFIKFRELKYAVSHVEKNAESDLYQLIQKKNALTQLYLEETPPHVQKFHYYPKNTKKKQH